MNIVRSSKGVFLSTLSLRRATIISIVPLILLTRFLSTLSLRRATAGLIFFCVLYHYFYPRSPCGERRKEKRCHAADMSISIHALLAESDEMNTVKLPGPVLFLSTLSLRRATLTQEVTTMATPKFLSTLSLRRATLNFCQNFFQSAISIHALLAESDPIIQKIAVLTITFLSTLSLRRATAPLWPV